MPFVLPAELDRAVIAHQIPRLTCFLALFDKALRPMQLHRLCIMQRGYMHHISEVLIKAGLTNITI